MNVKIKRLWHGYASVRDYQAKEAYEKGEDLVIECHDQFMRIPNREIITGSISGGKIVSKHTPGMNYTLIDYPWNVTDRQIPLL